MIAMIRKTGIRTISATLAMTMLATRLATSDRLRGACAARAAACALDARGRTDSAGARPTIARTAAPDARAARISPEMRDVMVVRTSGRAWPDCREGALERSMRRRKPSGLG